MPGVAARGGSRRRRTMNEINMVPFIDVMLVLLIIFMVSAPLITTGSVDLPSVGKSSQRPDKVIEVIVGKDEKLKLKVNGDTEERSLALGDLRERVLEAQGGDANVPVVISADRQVKYESVVQVMDRLQRAGVQRVGLSVKQGG
ncbi:protein TolR [Azohydromonas caseinilytica]|uniref:Protein TolR n=1 Tax=Azohydromonas caseinilytica TaxID=2728836 RepID=A0A848F905_9BURK|nr:protein TolR [Azohydromonas caseinilytica]NML14730.1 protein TolR [Azohydromonas caseinilytica]